MLTDQVEAQGAKISDLQSSLEEHQHKLDSTEEMLQQVLPLTLTRLWPNFSLHQEIWWAPVLISSPCLMGSERSFRYGLNLSSHKQQDETQVTSASWTDIPLLLGTNNLDNQNISNAQTPDSGTVSQSAFHFMQGETSLSGQVITAP